MFSIGGHPAFAAPLNKQGEYTDYFLQFNADEELTYHEIEENLMSNKTVTLKLEDKKLYLKHDCGQNLLLDALMNKIKTENHPL